MAGKTYRVPVRTGSIVELNIRTGHATSVDELNDAFVAAAGSAGLKGIFDVLHEGRVPDRRRDAFVDPGPAADDRTKW